MDRCLTTLGSRTILSWLENCRQLLGNFEHPLTISLQMVVLAFLALLLKIVLKTIVSHVDGHFQMFLGERKLTLLKTIRNFGINK